jgi:hypothetical protein
MASRLLSSLGQAVLFIAAHAFRVVAIATDEDSSTFASWPTITAGSAAPSEAQPNGSVYFRTNGTIYSMVSSAWVALVGTDSELSALAGLTSAADRVPYFTGAGTAALATFNALGRSLVGAASVAAARAALSLDTGDSPTFAQVTAALVGNVTGNVSGSSGSCTGNAATATVGSSIAAASVYASVEQTGTGGEQIFAHGLGSTPAVIWTAITEAPVALGSGIDVAYGVMSATELRFTVTTGIKFRVFAIK